MTRAPAWIAPALVGGLLAASPAHAVALFIDDFVTPQSVDVSAPAAVAASGNVANTATAIGVERDLWVEKTFGDAGSDMTARINPNGINLLRQSIGEALGRAVVTWDGPDGVAGPANVDFDGLGGLDFLIYDTLELKVTFSDLGGPVNFRFWSAADPTGNIYADTTFAVPGLIPSGSNVILTRSLSTPDFTAVGGTLASILGNVGAIQMTVDARAGTQEGWDSRYDFVRLTGPDTPAIPLPATLLLGLAGTGALGALGLRRRRRRPA